MNPTTKEPSTDKLKRILNVDTNINKWCECHDTTIGTRNGEPVQATQIIQELFDLYEELERKQTHLCLSELHKGVVSEDIGNQIEVTYETPEGPLKQIYSKSQFIEGKTPQEGDTVQATVTITKIENPKTEVSSNLPSFKNH